MATKKSDLNIQEKIAMCGVMLLGRDALPVAYAMSHPKAKTTSASSLNVMQSRWYASTLAKAFRDDMQSKLSRIYIDQGADLRTRDGVLSELISSVKATTGKDSVSGLQTLAKMQGFDKPEEGDDQKERRVYFLPWVSHCRTCALMKAYIESKSKP